MTPHELIRQARAARDPEEVARRVAAFAPGGGEARDAAVEALVMELWNGYGPSDLPHLQSAVERAFDSPNFESPEAFREAMRDYFGD